MRRINTALFAIATAIVTFNVLYIARPIAFYYFPEIRAWGMTNPDKLIAMSWYGLTGISLAAAALAGVITFAVAHLMSVDRPLRRGTLAIICAVVFISCITAAAHSIHVQRKWFTQLPGESR